MQVPIREIRRNSTMGRMGKSSMARRYLCTGLLLWDRPTIRANQKSLFMRFLNDSAIGTSVTYTHLINRNMPSWEKNIAFIVCFCVHLSFFF